MYTEGSGVMCFGSLAELLLLKLMVWLRWWYCCPPPVDQLPAYLAPMLNVAAAAVVFTEHVVPVGNVGMFPPCLLFTFSPMCPCMCHTGAAADA